MFRKILLSVAGAAAVLGVAMPTAAKADTYSTFGNTAVPCTAAGCVMSSSPTTYTGAYVEFGVPFAASSLTQLSATFTDLAGGVTGGSPRFLIGLVGGGSWTVYLGDAPGFVD